jgi:site-specific DNA-methyltransferase (adenine-specific)
MPYDVLVNGIKYGNDGEELSDEKLQQLCLECLDKFPTHKKYQVIYADPPWFYSSRKGSQTFKGVVNYPMMSLESLKSLPVQKIAEDNCALFMWVTNPKIPDALELLQHWGFEFKTVFMYWRKTFPNGNLASGCGWWTRPCMEQLWVATKGNVLKKWKTSSKLCQEFTSVRPTKTVKPEQIRNLVRDFFRVDRRIELFARHWADHGNADFGDSWGLETPGYFWEAPKECILNTPQSQNPDDNDVEVPDELENDNELTEFTPKTEAKTETLFDPKKHPKSKQTAPLLQAPKRSIVVHIPNKRKRKS